MAIEQLIFTDCPRGKGIDPNASGLQIKACSDGLNQDLKWQLSNICMHHGQAFSISKAPHDAIEMEQEWLSKTPDRKTIPESLLDRFPVIWSYDVLQDDLFALTRVKYLCLTNDGRTGNFIAHALVFNTSELAPYNFHPLALSCSEIFSDPILSGNNTLSKLQDLRITTKLASNFKLVQNETYQEHFPAMVSALSAAIQETRPVLICLSNWHHSFHIVDVLLNTLPPRVRCRTTFCTYESDRNWKVPNKTGQPVKQMGSRTLSVLYGVENRSFDFRSDEYKSLFAVFNFVGNEFSEMEEPNQYAKFTTGCIFKGNLQKLTDYHNLIEQLGFEHVVEVWSSLIPAVALSDKQPTIENLKIATVSLLAITKNVQQAEIVLELFTPHIKSLAMANNSKDLSTLSSDLATLVEFLPEVVVFEKFQGFINTIFDLAGNALINGQIGTTTALIKACGKYHDELLLRLLKKFFNKLQSNFVQTLVATEKEELTNLLLKCLHILGDSPDADIPFNQLLVLTFQVANEAGVILKTWKNIGEETVIKILDGEWDTEKQKLAEELSNYITADNCPDASAWLRMKLLKMIKMQDKQLQKLLIDTADACSRSKTSLELSRELLETTKEKYLDEELRTIVLGQMAEVTRDTEQQELFFQAYEKMIQKCETKQQNKILRELASSKVAYILCRQLIDDVLPWIEDDSNKKMQHWHDVVIKPYPHVIQVLYQELTLLLQKPENLENILPLIKELLTRSQYKTISDSNLSELYNAIIFALSLEPLSQQWSQIFDSSSIKLKSEGDIRLSILNFLKKVEQLAEKEDWSIEKFPETDQAWQKNIPLLSPSEKKKIIEWCISKFKDCGVTTSTEAIKLTNLLKTLEMFSLDNLVEVMNQLLVGRDPVTCVMAITAFANCGLEYPSQVEHWGKIVGATLDRFDKDTQRLFKLHLKQRFHKPGRQYEENLENFLIAAGLELPKPKSDSVKGIDTGKGPLSTLIQHRKVTGVLDDISRQLRNVISGLKGIKRSSKSQKKGDL